MSFLKSGVTWLKHNFAWSNTWASWQERVVLALFLLLAVGLGILSAYVVLWQAVLAWAVYFVALAVCSWQGWLKLFGPVLFYDMIRTARRSRYVVMRLLYAGMLLFILCFMYLSVFAERRVNNPEMMFFSVSGFFAFVLVEIVLIILLMVVPVRPIQYGIGGLILLSAVLFIVGVVVMEMTGGQGNPNNNVRDSAIFAEAFFSAFMIVQVVMVLLLTPAYVAGAIAEEKDRKTLEFMLATDLNNREIILSKLLSRLANMTLLLLTGLPILSLLQFVGGVDTVLMLSGFAGTALTILGIGSLSILLSTLFQKPRDAIGATYLFIITYCALGTTAKSSAMAPPLTWMRDPLWEAGPSLADVSNVLNSGNPIAAVIEVVNAINSATLGRDLPDILTRYAWFHGILAAVCIVWSIVRLRAIALKQTVGGTTKKLSWWQTHRPPIGDLPMMWKEFNIEGRMKLNWLAWGVVIVLVVLTVGTGLLIVGVYLWDVFTNGMRDWRGFHEGMNVWFRIAGTGVACLMILIVAVRASTSITNERERDTFDALITTPMSGNAILGAKLLGTVTSLRMGWLWFGVMLAIGMFTGGIHLLAVPILINAWYIYATFFTMVGMWYSMACESSMRATVYTVITTLFLGGGHWVVLGLCCYTPLSFLMIRGNSGDSLRYLAMFHAGMTPPFVLGLSAYSWQDLAQNFNHREMTELLVFSMIGLFLWAMGCVILWFGVLVPKFRQIARREELIYE